MGAALSSVPLCSRARGGAEVEVAGADSNNNLDTEVDNNLAVVTAEPVTAAAGPVETSTPKLERDLGVVLEVDGAEAAAESLASDQFGPRSSSGHSEDSGLEHSGDEAELAGFTGETDADYLDTALDTDEEEEDDDDDETHESLESGDLGVDRATAFRVRRPEVSEAEAGEGEAEAVTRKLAQLEDGAAAVTSRLSELDIWDAEQTARS